MKETRGEVAFLDKRILQGISLYDFISHNIIEIYEFIFITFIVKTIHGFSSDGEVEVEGESGGMFFYSCNSQKRAISKNEKKN